MKHSAALAAAVTGANVRLISLGRFWGVLSAAIVSGAVTPVALCQTETISVDLDLRTGGALSGLVVDHTSEAIVIVHDRRPYVFSWDEIQPRSAFDARRALVILQRGGVEGLTAEDHFELGRFALSHRQTDSAAVEFRLARQLDPGCEPRVRRAYAAFGKRKRNAKAGIRPSKKIAAGTGLAGRSDAGLFERVDAVFADSAGRWSPDQVPAEARARILEVYKSFGETVRQVISPRLVLIETEHFLIWTDWERSTRSRLADWCESMYRALCEQFELDPAEDIFLAKCPVFCWQTEGRFRRFAAEFDGHDAQGAIGYTRSIEDKGHVHLVLMRGGRSQAAYDRFAGTLVHEGTHAFLHRLFTPRLIPHWINEGYADVMVQRVLGDRCHTADKARLLAKQYVLYDWPISDMLNSVGPIEIHQYPLACSVVAYLEFLGKGRFAEFIRQMKQGRSVSSALASSYEGLTVKGLEVGWRSAIRADDRVDDD